MEDDGSEALPEGIVEAFGEEGAQSIEKQLDGGELYDFVTTMLVDWVGDDLDELFDLLETSLAEIDVDLTSEYAGDVDDTEVLEDENEFPDTSDFTPDDDDDDL